MFLLSLLLLHVVGVDHQELIVAIHEFCKGVVKIDLFCLFF